jgi:hypothetical protein
MPFDRPLTSFNSSRERQPRKTEVELKTVATEGADLEEDARGVVPVGSTSPVISSGR